VRRKFGVGWKLISVPKTISKDFERNHKQVMKMLDQLKKEIEKLDPTLQERLKRRARKIDYQMDKLRRKTGRAQDTKAGILSNHENFLENLLYPHKTLQFPRVVPVAISSALGPGRLGGLAKCVGAKTWASTVSCNCLSLRKRGGAMSVQTLKIKNGFAARNCWRSRSKWKQAIRSPSDRMEVCLRVRAAHDRGGYD